MKVPMGSTVNRIDLADINLENPPPHSFAPTCGSTFQVRHGPNYAKTGAKSNSEPNMFEIYAVDVFRTRRKCPHIMRFVDIPEEFRNVSKADPDDPYIPKFLVVNFMLPAYAPSLWGATEYDGESYSVVLYLIISPEAMESIKAGTTNASALLRQWFQMDPMSPEDYALRGRLKAIPILCNPEKINLGIGIGRLVRSYNSKPFLTGPKYHSFVKESLYIECDVDIHLYVYPARKTFNNMLPEIPRVVIDIGLVVEAKSDDEMPEQMLASARLSCIGPDKALLLDTD